MNDPMTRDELLLKARELPVRLRYEDGHLFIENPISDGWAGIGVPMGEKAAANIMAAFSELADFCLSELAAQDLEIEKLRKALRRLDHVYLQISPAILQGEPEWQEICAAHREAEAALQREGPEGKP